MRSPPSRSGGGKFYAALEADVATAVEIKERFCERQVINESETLDGMGEYAWKPVPRDYPAAAHETQHQYRAG